MEILFEKFQPEDFSLYYSVVKENEVMKYVTGKGLAVEEAKTNFENYLLLNIDEGPIGYYKIIQEKTGSHIGNCKLVNYKYNNSQFEIGYLLKQEFWGQGIGTKVCEFLLNLADEENPSRSVVGIIDPKNAGSKRLLEKFGFITYFLGIENNWETEKLILRKNESS